MEMEEREEIAHGTIRLLKELGLQLISPQNNRNRPVPFVRLSRLGVSSSHPDNRTQISEARKKVINFGNCSTSRNSGPTIFTKRDNNSCTICSCSNNPCAEVGPRLLKLLDDFKVGVAVAVEGEENEEISSSSKTWICETCWKLLDGIGKLQAKVEALQTQIRDGVMAIKALVRLAHGGQGQEGQSDDKINIGKGIRNIGELAVPRGQLEETAIQKDVKNVGKVGARPRFKKRRKIFQHSKRKLLRNSTVAKALVEEDQVQPENEEIIRKNQRQSKLIRPRSRGEDCIGRDPLALDEMMEQQQDEMEIKEEPLDFEDFLDDPFEPDDEEHGVDLPGPVVHPITKDDSDLLGDEGAEEVDLHEGRGRRKSKIKAYQTLAKIAKEEEYESQVDPGSDRDSLHSETEEQDLDKKLNLNPRPAKKRPFLPYKKRKLGPGTSTSRNLTNRRKRVPFPTTPPICTPCGLTFPSHPALRVHNNRCHDPHTCTHCGMEFKCRKSWTDHVRAKHEAIRRHPCPHSCGKSFYKRSACDEHGDVCPKNPNPEPADLLRQKLAAKPSSHLCHLCGNGFKCPATLKYHILRVHQVAEEGGDPPEPKFCCPTCPRKFWTSSGLKNHLERHKPVAERLICEDCPLENGGRPMFKTLRERLEHTRRVHLGKVTYPCDLCGMKFVKPTSLRWHVQESHKAREGHDERLTCAKCGVTFCGMRTLMRHEKYYNQKGLDCTKGVHKRGRILGKLFGPPPPGQVVAARVGPSGTRLPQNLIQKCVEAMGQGRNGSDNGGGSGCGAVGSSSGCGSSEEQVPIIRTPENEEVQNNAGDGFANVDPVFSELIQ